MVRLQLARSCWLRSRPRCKVRWVIQDRAMVGLPDCAIAAAIAAWAWARCSGGKRARVSGGIGGAPDDSPVEVTSHRPVLTSSVAAAVTVLNVAPIARAAPSSRSLGLFI